jgi:S1-C subfamily serine protease
MPRRLLPFVGAFIAAAFLWGLVMAPTAANAVELRRQAVPIVAGTRLAMAQGGDCTAGVIMKKDTGFLRSLVSPRENATRYAVIAAHCVQRSDEVVLVAEEPVGKVVMRSPDHDLALVQIDPEVRQLTHCHVTSFGPSCSRSYSYTPRASGQVFLDTPRPGARGGGPVPMVGYGVPSAGEHFCTSGSSTGTQCSWQRADIPTGSIWHQRGVPKSARSLDAVVTKGDSGGPVVSQSGRFYGIISDSGVLTGEPDLVDQMGYTDAHAVMVFAAGYSMAPAS